MDSIEKALVVFSDNSHFLAAINALLDNINDKDESVRNSIENAISRICEKRANLTLECLCEYRTKQPKLGEQQIALILRIIDNFTIANAAHLSDTTIDKVIDLAIMEIIKASENSVNIQRPGLEILVAIGRIHCKKVMENLSKQLHKGQLAHFMILQTMGTIATANIIGVMPFIKPTFELLLPTLAMIKTDHLKQSYAFAIGHFAEAIMEYSIQDNDMNFESNETTNKYDFHGEIAIAYEIFLHQWLPNREPKICSDILQALSNMYPLLSGDKVRSQIPKIIQIIFNFYRRSMDRNAITQLLVSVIKKTIQINSKALKDISADLINNLFDLVCVNPDYEKPQTVKGHYEVLRCFNLLLEICSDRIMDMLLVQLRTNNERERIKSLLVLTHIVSTADHILIEKQSEFLDTLKFMIQNEKMLKVKLILLKTIVAFAQKNFITHLENDKEFIRFILRNCCKLQKKYNNEYGSQNEYMDFLDNCTNSIYILSTNIHTMNNLLKQELLKYYLLIDYTSVCGTIAKCLAKLFQKTYREINGSNNNKYDDVDDDENNGENKSDKNNEDKSVDDDEKTDFEPIINELQNASDAKFKITNPEIILIRSLILLGNTNDIVQTKNILNFLKYFCSTINENLITTWNECLDELGQLISASTSDSKILFISGIYRFLQTTMDKMTLYNANFSEMLVNKIADQLPLYPSISQSSVSPATSPTSEYLINDLTIERGMLLKLLGISLCYITDQQTIDVKIDLIINTVKLDKLDKTFGNYENRLKDPAESLGFISRIHLDIILKKIETIKQTIGTSTLNVVGGGGGGLSSKTSGNFFSSLNFLRDTQKELDNYKLNFLIIESYEYIIENAPTSQILIEIDEKIIDYLYYQLIWTTDNKDLTMRKLILTTLLRIIEKLLETIVYPVTFRIKSKTNILLQLLRIDTMAIENLPLFPIVLKLATLLLRVPDNDSDNDNHHNNSIMTDSGLNTGDFNASEFFEEFCRKFFTSAQKLKTKFETIEEDEKNSYLAQYLNLTLPELNLFIKELFKQNSSPAMLDDVVSVLDLWIKDKNTEVRICAGHVMNSSLDFYLRTMKIGCEAPSKFNQTGSMLGKAVPRCIDSNATVRQTSVDIVKKILEISCVYETLTIADSNVDWVTDLLEIRENITTDDAKEMYKLTSDMARVISVRLSNFQYLQFCKTLLHSLNDPEQSAVIGASVILKIFVQLKGAELFHAIPEYVKEALFSIAVCQIPRAKSGILKSLVALTKHHPKMVCNEMLSCSLPLESNVVEFWQCLSADAELTGIILDNFFAIINSSCLFEPQDSSDRQHIAAVQPFSIFCALREIFATTDIKEELTKRFPEIFCVLLSSIATYINVAPPMVPNSKSIGTVSTSGQTKNKYGFIPNKDAIKLNPCLIVLETLQECLNILNMEQILAVLHLYPQLATSNEISNFIDILTPMAFGLVYQFGIGSSVLKQIVTHLSKYVSSPYETQRLTAIGLYSQLIPSKPSGEIASVILLHLNSALNDPTPVVRGFSIRGLSYICNLTEHDVRKYSEMALSALLKGIDDSNPNCYINIPLESMRGLSRILNTINGEKLETFQLSLAIRIRPFFENSANDIREAAILVFGDICKVKTTELTEDSKQEMNIVSEPLREQLFTNFMPLLLHLCESDGMIVLACKITLRKICFLINAPKVNTMIQNHLLDYGQLHYDVFIADLLKIITVELKDYVGDFIESCLPFLKSSWPELRGNASIIIGLLHSLSDNVNNTNVGHYSSKISLLLRDENKTVRVKAATALGYIFGDIV